MMSEHLAAPWRSVSLRRTGWGLLLLLVLLANAIPYSKLVHIDDAYISYRYAANLLQHGQLAYDLDGDKAFAATSPGYAVVLAGLGATGLDLPAVGYLLGVASILAAAVALAALLRGWPFGAGIGAAVLLIALPLPWLVIGMESVPVMALVLLAFACTIKGRHGYAAALLALATVLRFDAVSAAAAWGVWLLLTLRRKSVLPMAGYAAGVLGVYGALRLFLNAPLPTTLASKQAQVELGISGFPPHTGFLPAVGLLARAHLDQSPFFWGIGFLALLGVLALIVRGVRHSTVVARGESAALTPNRSALLAPFALLALWAIFNLAAYLILGVSPYLWYYLPLFPLVAALVAAGITLLALSAGRWVSPGPRSTVAAALAVILWLVALAGPIASHLAIRRAQPELGGGNAPVAASLLLPNGQWGPYKAIGERLRTETAPSATVGMMEIGITGYYSQRKVVDFLGLLDTDVAAALGRGDMSWALYAKQPDYLVLGDVYPMYTFNVYQNRWFQGNYALAWIEPRHTPQGRWWAVYRRKTPSAPAPVVDALPAGVEPLQIRFGDQLELAGFDAPAGPWRPEDPVGATLYWKVLKQPGQDLTLFVHLRDGRGNIIAARDAPPLLGARPTSQWQPGELIADYQPLGLPPMPLAPTDLTFEVGLYDGTGGRLPAFGVDGKEIPGGQAQFGRRQLEAGRAPIRFGAGGPGDDGDLAITGYSLSSPSLARGSVAQVELQVSEAAAPVQVTAELWDGPGQRILAEGKALVSEPGVYRLTLDIRGDEPANEGELRVRASRDDAALGWLDAAGHEVDDFAPLTPLAIGAG